MFWSESLASRRAWVVASPVLTEVITIYCHVLPRAVVTAL